jgi:hypothetical protein
MLTPFFSGMGAGGYPLWSEDVLATDRRPIVPDFSQSEDDLTAAFALSISVAEI